MVNIVINQEIEFLEEKKCVAGRETSGGLCKK